MDQSDFPTSRSPRKEIQGTRPPPLKVRKESRKIKKPPLAPAPQPQQPPRPQEAQQPRAPVVIYTVSPKVIHANPSEFMTIVQRLTGFSSSSSSSASSTSMTTTNTTSTIRAPFIPLNDDYTRDGPISPAARYAAIEKANASSTSSPEKWKQLINQQSNTDLGFVEIEQHHHVVERSNIFPGILSPGPSSLPPISPSFFSPLPADPNMVYHDPSLVLQGNSAPSPTSIFSSFMTSPSSIDLFNNLFRDL